MRNRPATTYLVTADPRFAHDLGQRMSSFGIELRVISGDEFSDPVKAQERSGAPVVFDRPSIGSACDQVLSTLRSGNRVITLTEGDAQEAVRWLADHSHVNHLKSREAAGDSDMFATLQKLRGDPLWGVQPYLGKAAEIHSRTVQGPEELDQAVAEIEAYAAALGCFPEFGRTAATSVRELLMNALRPAPAGAGSEHDEHATVTFGHDDQMFVFSVCDAKGHLSRNTVVENLTRSLSTGCPREPGPDRGAGLGLAMVLFSVHFLAFNLRSNEKTEAVGGLRLSKRYRDFVRDHGTISFFYETDADYV